MKLLKITKYGLCFFAVFFYASSMSVSFATVPGPADVGRIEQERQDLLPKKNDTPPPERGAGERPILTPVPRGGDSIFFVLKEVQVEGATAFSRKELSRIYRKDIGQKIPLSRAWAIADEINRLYSDAGFFLSYAFVPEQKIGEGVLTIKVIEGYVENIEISDSALEKKPIIRSLQKKLLSRRPVKSKDIESFLLRMNDLPGLSFRSVLSPLADMPGAVRLSLITGTEKDSAYVSFDNYNSRFLGPNQVLAGYRSSLLPLQDTSVFVSSAPRLDLVYNSAINHRVPVGADLDMIFEGSYSRANPAFTLKSQDIQSRSYSYGLTFDFQPLRSRQDNVKMNLSFDLRDTHSDTIGTPLVREKIRALRLGMNYQGYGEGGKTYNAMDVSLSRGLNILDASPKGQINLSRIQARPNFIKLNFNYTHARFLTNHWQAAIDLRTQLAPQALHSPEQFGYGGQNAGRAFDPSEILGDNGVIGALEFRYSGMRGGANWGLQPYVFYDVGAIWNEGVNQAKASSATSAGGGVRFNNSSGINSNIGFAFPLTREPQNPIYGVNENGPRILLQMTREF